MIVNKPLYKAPKHDSQNAEVCGLHKIPFWKEPGNCTHIEPSANTMNYHQNFESTEEAININQFLPIASDHLDDIQNQTAKDIALQKLGLTISNGSFENRNAIPAPIGPYLDIRDELTNSKWSHFQRRQSCHSKSNPQGYAAENPFITPWS